jgi:glycosyltransferase involved in cell wall biosynthesis
VQHPEFLLAEPSLEERRMGKILMLNEPTSTFLKNDYAILKESGHEVDLISSDSYIGYFKQWRKARGYDLYFSWWGTSLCTVVFAKLFNGKSMIVAGGVDAAEVPEIHYGAFTTWKKHLVKFVFQTADVVLPVSETTRMEVLRHSKPRSVRVIYNGIDTERYKPEGLKENMVLTVSKVGWSTIKKKGLETFVRCAKYLPDVPFILVGKHEDSDCVNHLTRIASPNVRIPGYVSFEELLGYYRRAKVYVQVSFHESFGVALGEAMSCGCIPVVTRQTALPEVVGDTGFYVPYGNPKATAKAIREALNAASGGRRKARDRIKDMFPLQKRKEKLVEIINIMIR